MTDSLPKLLLIDDDATFLQVMARAMRRRGFDVFTADNGASTQKLLERHTPDYAVVDLKLLNESGLSLLPELKTANPKMEIVLLTGFASIATAVEAVKLGANNYLCKPADADEVVSALLCQPADPTQLKPSAPLSVDQLEWEHIQRILQEQQGNISATARVLGMHRRTLQRKLQKPPAASQGVSTESDET
ncbi:response regulator transcription factor [Aestuariirhabdus sp. Z084]|uniref:response regulator transcription factor n=1 Tax=Aestuariirhabdus haliotis TaxID=2918751 RepID=UPI00201B37EB|nr:response regulator transcription factor [Aestuariirhabdus haliotis]MCL6417421.1 response regulator transcription factor [Aestuariirhabdus haliotis]MCL6421365.1 response regulator transcription factor [Aestuariirhabdus haliotis]